MRTRALTISPPPLEWSFLDVSSQNKILNFFSGNTLFSWVRQISWTLNSLKHPLLWWFCYCVFYIVLLLIVIVFRVILGYHNHCADTYLMLLWYPLITVARKQEIKAFFVNVIWAITCLIVSSLIVWDRDNFFLRGGNHCFLQHRRDGFSLIIKTLIVMGKP